jgi:hypothetical protein
MGRVGLNKADALSLTSEEVEAVLESYTEGVKDQWKLTRWHATIVANFSGNAKRSGVKPTDFFKFDDEKYSSGIRELFKIAKNERNDSKPPIPRT